MACPARRRVEAARRLIAYATFLTFCAAPFVASAADVLVVPASQEDPDLPHTVHELAPITLKAVLRDAACANGYDITWDVDRDSDFSNNASFFVSQGGEGLYSDGTYYDIGRTWTTPDVDRDRIVTVSVRARSRCAGEEDAVGTYLLFVYDWAPDPNLAPLNAGQRIYRYWPREQVDIMGLMAVQETLWYLHRRLRSFGGNGMGIRGNVDPLGNSYCGPGGDRGRNTAMVPTAAALWVMTINGRLPAFPPGSVGDADLAGLNAAHITRPDIPLDEWRAANDFRWANDPYAETAARFANYVARSFERTAAVAAEDEAITCGFSAPGVERSGSGECGAAIPDSRDGEGAWPYRCWHYCDTAGEGYTDAYNMGKVMGGLATVLPALGGVNIRAGQGVGEGRPWEWLVQQTVDAMGWAQIDAGVHAGGWLYCANQSTNDASTAQWGYIGLESADVAGREFGVNVNNRHKYRIANAIVNNQNGNGAATYRTNVHTGNNLQLTGGAFVGLRWLGVHTMDPNSNVKPFGVNYADYTESQLRRAYDRYLAYASNAWYSTSGNCSIGNCADANSWSTSLFGTSDFLCGDTNGVYNQIATAANPDPNCGNTYGMYSFQKGFRTGTPEVTEADFGVDWYAQFTTYFVRAQRRAMGDANGRGGNYTAFGSNSDTRGAAANNSGLITGSAWGGLVMTPSIFTPTPVALADAQPAQVLEGCADDNAGEVTFSHAASFHPNRNASIVRVQWDFDASDGLWWDTGAAADFQDVVDVDTTPQQLLDEGVPFTYEFAGSGTYTATLRITDDADPAQSDTATVQITVTPDVNEAPTVAAGGPYTLEADADAQLLLRGTADDRNLDCGDTITVGWDLDGDGVYTDAGAPGANPPAIAFGDLPAALQNAPRGVPQTIGIQAVDGDGEVTRATTTITIYPAEPTAVADFRPRPQPACNQTVTFDGSGSGHPNPDRSIALYEWDVDGDGNFDGGGDEPTFEFAYAAFGTYTVTLRVTDDGGRTDTTTIDVPVLAGNRPPTADSPREYSVNEGEVLTLDGSRSSDPDVGCGDSIAEYAWDLDGDGNFGGANDANGANPEIDWDDLIGAGLQVVDNRAAGTPFNTVTLRVTDGFGLSATLDVTVRLFRALPVPVVNQRPLPAPISIVDGRARVFLDCLESFSPIPGVGISRCDWSLNDDDIIERPDQDLVQWVLFIDDIPAAGQETTRTIRLQVTDDEGRPATIRYDVRFRTPPTPPTADADPTQAPERDYHILLGDGVQLDGSQSADPDDGDCVATWRWAINAGPIPDDQTFAEAGVDFLERNIAAGCDDADAPLLDLTAQGLADAGVDAAGAYEIVLEVEDLTGLTARDTATLNVYERLPAVAFDLNPNPTACPGAVTADGAASDHPHPSFEVVTWAWDFDGDGEYDDADGPRVNVLTTTLGFGTSPISLQVTDNKGDSNVLTLDLDITEGNQAPVADPAPGAGSTYRVPLGADLVLDGRESRDPDAACGDSVQSWAWTIEGDAAGVGPTLTLDAAAQAGLGLDDRGTFGGTLTVTDSLGNSAVQNFTVILVGPPSAVAIANPDRAACLAPVIFDGRASTIDPLAAGDARFDLVAYDWDFDGDGNFETPGAFVQRAIDRPDGLTGTLRVTDGLGRTATAEATAEASFVNVPPTARPGGPYATGRLPDGTFAPARLDGRASADPNAPCDGVAEYRWDTNGDNAPDIIDDTGVVEYTNPGWAVGVVQTVSLVVCDTFGACSAPIDTQIRVEAEPPPVGDIISPRGGADACIAAADFTVVVDVSDPEGEVVEATVILGGVRVATRAGIDTPDDGSPIRVEIVVPAAAVAGVNEGNRNLQVELNDGTATTTVDAGGALPVDRTAPDVAITDGPAEGFCYNPDATPDPVIEAVDALDNAPVIDQEVVEDACVRTLTVTATDTCGNVGTAVRTYRVAQPVDLDIDGPAEGALVAPPATLSWEVVGPPQCSNGVSAQVRRPDGNTPPYNEGAALVDPGNYAVTLTALNCQPVGRQIIRNFTVNRPPVGDAAGPYVADEGAGLQIDASRTQAPERTDRIDSYEWDFGNARPGGFQAGAVLEPFPTEEDGAFQGRLRVTDSLGAESVVAFDVTINDVDPIPALDAPDEVPQGADFVADASASRPGSGADLITTYTFDWGDGTPPTVTNDPNATHAYADDGVYNIELTVADEDSQRSVSRQIEVVDVNPEIADIDPPVDGYEIAPMQFTAEVSPGAPGDPIVSYTWVFGDGSPPVVTDGPIASHMFESAGDYIVEVTVADSDSVATLSREITIREITLRELVAEVDRRVGVAIAAGGRGQARLEASETPTWLANARWGEAAFEDGDGLQRRGNAFLALGQVIEGIVDAVDGGVNLDGDNTLWALARQLDRTVIALQDEILSDDNGIDADNPSMVRAQSFIDAMRQVTDTVYNDPDTGEPVTFREVVDNPLGSILALDQFARAQEAFFFLTDAVDPCNSEENDGFRVPEFGDPEARVGAADEVNQRLHAALGDLATELSTYADAPGAVGAEQVADALAIVQQLRQLTAQPVALVCEPGACLTDRDALELALGLSDLALAMFEAEAEGVWVRNWQNCLILGTRFRVELSILRVEFVCGPNVPASVAARDRQETGLALVDDRRDTAALLYYSEPDTTCLIIETYNECLSAPGAAGNEPYEDVPAYCAAP